MNDKQQHQLNRVFLFFSNKETEKAYTKYAFKYDRRSFRVMTMAAVIINLAVFFVDWSRASEWQGPALVRVSAAIILLVGFISTFFIENNKPRFLQIAIFIVLLLLVLSYLVSMSIVAFPDFTLPNTMVTVIFFSISLSGLRYRYGIIYLVFAYISYVVLFTFIVTNAFWASQIIDITVNSLIGLTAAYIIETSRRDNFIKNIIVEHQKTELESVDALKNKLFSVLSHDLRGPLRKLIAMLDMLKKQQISREDFEEHTEKIEDEVKITSSYMENLLYWSKSLISGFQPSKREIDVKQIVDQNLAIVEESALAKNIQVQNHVIEASMVVSDEDTLNICLRNLLSNAVKFTPSGGKIDIDYRSLNEYVEIYISDTGKGIENERLGELFSLKTISTAGTEGEKGTGLGLYLLKEFLERNGGSIRCESEIGKGSTFYIRLLRNK